MAAAAIAGFEQHTQGKDFAAFHIDLAKRYKAHLNTLTNEATGKPLAKATLHSRLSALKAFFFWLAGQSGYKSRIAYADADYFNLSANDSRVATARRETRAPSLEQVELVLSKMPFGSDIEKRDRAIIAFTLLTGARDDATASLKLKHVNLQEGIVYQDAREVRTKARKTITTYFFPVSDQASRILTEWVEHLKRTLLFGPDDPLFPSTRIGLGNEMLFGAQGLTRDHWKNAQAIRRIFRQAFEAAGLPYSNPHSLRNTLAMLGEQRCRTREEFKAWSQNLGHEHVLTTFTSYGTVSATRQGELVRAVRERSAGDGNEMLAKIKALVNSSTG